MTVSRRKIYSWIAYICSAIMIQCLCIVAMVAERGGVTVGSEYLIIPVMVGFRAWIPGMVAELNGILDDLFRVED